MNFDDGFNHVDLMQEALHYSDERFNEALRVLRKYYKLEVPVATVRKVIASDATLVQELNDDSISDTYPRGILLDGVLAELGLPNWPYNCDSAKTKDDFMDALENAELEGKLKYLD